MFQRVLIANRGEIAIRIIRCLRELGIEAVAVYSDPDRKSLAVRWADLAVSLPGATSAETYMNMDAVIAAAQKTDCEAIHPGYGFLSENAEFARRCQQAGLVFIGPHPEAIALMGDKTTARRLMLEAGVPVTPGFQKADADMDAVMAAAEEIGFPVMLKAAAGGGGKGMRLVKKAGQLRAAYEMAGSEALNAFGDGRVYLEKFIERPRHIEVQVVCDRHGNAIHLGERECSIQRRHQKVVEEAPSPAVDAKTREKIGAIAIRAAQAVRYDSVGTIEFLMDQKHHFYFMEMNTRLQVEHPVTEWVTGLDLVRLQLGIAAGETLSLKQEDVTHRGHALECRIYAEDPTRNFMPSPGRITALNVPGGQGVRDDSGVYQGYEVPIYYDPMISKLTTWGATREEAIQRMSRALGEYQVGGIETNLSFHRRIMQHPAFQEGALDTGFIERHAELLAKPDGSPRVDMALAAAAIRYFKDEVKKSDGQAAASGSAGGWKNHARQAILRGRW